MSPRTAAPDLGGSSSSSSATSSSLFLVTSPDPGLSKTIAGELVSSKLAACVNIVPRVTSVYWWDGRVQEDSEELLIIKSRNELKEQLEAKIKSLHPYDTPEFISIPIADGSKEYLDWIQASTTSK